MAYQNIPTNEPRNADERRASTRLRRMALTAGLHGRRNLIMLRPRYKGKAVFHVAIQKRHRAKSSQFLVWPP